VKTIKHPSDRALSRYRYWRKKLRDVEKNFDAFIRAHRDDETRRKYAEKANAAYFDIKARLQSIRADYHAAQVFSRDCT